MSSEFYEVKPTLLIPEEAMWDRAEVTLELTSALVGGIPQASNLIEGWIKSRMKDITDDERAKIAAADKAELPQLTEDEAKAKGTTFKVDAKGIFLESRCVKAMLKESGNIIREMLSKAEAKGKKPQDKDNDAKPAKEKSRFTALRSKVAEEVFVEGHAVHIERDGKVLTKPDGSYERPINVITPQGERTSIKRVDYVDPGSQITFRVRWLKGKVMDVDLLATILAHASYNGLGADRSQGNGQFIVKSIKVPR